ncbi:helix-turn-helix domain-containing protein [Dyadobacter sandarakinus]|uniref:helix-turn-helix domain-containing protein n=1 Tax=Dyadobacter sandarakinus TaxID=2747268 RepID=UPI001E53E863|nr:AraC family transcriptional regulator [Dyadobacter sandarakinus]
MRSLPARAWLDSSRDFRKTFGIPPWHWLLDRRLTEAKHLIEHRQQKPSSIYLEVGFESLTHFLHSFK